MENPALFLTILLPPFAGALFLGLAGRRLPRHVPGVVASALVLVSFAASLRGFLELPAGGRLEADFGPWFALGGLTVRFHFLLDPLASLMTLVVSGVGFLIHVYSIGYMEHERRDERFFAYLNLFAGMMLVLVTGANLPLLFVGWEGVGLCSYLLIGYWFEDDRKAAAGMKAFIVNRVGDLGFLVGIFLLWKYVGTVTFTGLNDATVLAETPRGLLFFTALCLFLGGTGKSAQIPLYIWLPDAMAGPTPVSALIHAATMVTAGVYMIGRLGAFFAAAGALPIVAAVGAATAFYAATMALVERDIKKVLAYSTISQLGYMFLAMGAGAYAAGIFHLYTHAFFKALLFLAAGSVIHALHGEQDLRRMGGLARRLPLTTATFIVGGLALAGFPLTAGYFSKDEILLAAKGSPVLGSLGPVLWLLGEATALLTAFYVGRLIYLAFFGRPRLDAARYAAVHESPPVMTVPLVLLALGAVFGGYVNLPHVLAPGGAPLHAFLEIPGQAEAPVTPAAEWFGLGLSGVVSLLGLGLAYVLIGRKAEALALWLRRPALPGRIHALLLAKYYVDGWCMRYLGGGTRRLARVIHLVDDFVVDAFLVRGVCGLFVRLCGEGLRLVQAGPIQAYGLLMVLGSALMLLYLLLQGGLS